MTELAPLLAAIVVAVIAPIGAYVLAARKMSGKVDTSEASELWAESRSIRDDYRQRLADAADRTRDLEARVAKLEGVNADLVRENQELRAKIVQLEAIIEELRDTITRKDEELEAEK